MYQESQYSRFQRSVSYLLIFAIFFVNSFQLSFFDKTKAEEIKNIQLISLIVHENVYGAIQSRINRYAEDVQAKLSNTKVLIYKVPENITPQKIAALNEKLFYEGDGNNDNSKLIGTILVGDIPLPVIHDTSKTFLSVYPYIDFNEKNFIYNNDSGFYEKSLLTPKDINPEIWHSIIAPNTGDENKDRIKLIEFFDKDHDYYAKSGIFSKSLQEPYVFYYDGKRDEESATYSLRKGYELYIKNIEDISYNRFNKYLTQQLSDAFYAATNSELSGSLLEAGQNNPELKKYIEANLGTTGIDATSVPDVISKNIIEKLTKKFFQVFNEKYIGDILKYVYNTGRYGNTNNTRVDTIISLVSKRDNGVKRILKDSNTVLEDYLDDILKKGAARNIAVPVKIEESKHYRYPVSDGIGGENGGTNNMVCRNTGVEGEGYSTKEYKNFEGNNYVGVLENFFYGTIGSNINKAVDCSIYRGTKRAIDNKSIMAEATRAYNYDQTKIKADTALLQSSPNAQTCFAGGKPNTMGFWGGYSLFNMTSDGTGSTLKLGPTDYRRATKTIYDPAGGVIVGYNSSSDTQDTLKDVANKDIETSSVKDCLDFNWMYTNPDNLSPSKSQCNNKMSEHVAPYDYEPYTGDTFENLYKNIGGKVYFAEHSYDYHNKSIFLDNKQIKSHSGDSGGCDKYIVNTNYYYKKVLGVVEHKSPTDEEFGAQLTNMATPSLPSDRNRYVDFVSAKGNEIKFEYPNLYRIRVLDTKNLNYDYVKNKVKEYLDTKSSQFNTILQTENPSTLTGQEKEIYTALKSGDGDYTTNIDFYGLLSKDTKVLDEVVKNVLWINLNSTAIKYKYVLENYLDIDGNSESLDAGHKSDYEIAYIGSKGDAGNMYLGIDLSKPKEADANAASNALARYNSLKSFLSANKITLNSNSGDAQFKCGPAEGVPIFQWFSAIMCRLKTLVSPIAIQGGACSSKTLGLSNSNGMSNEFGGEFATITNPAYNEDKDGNGIPDGAELINKGKISLISDKTMYSYGKTARIKANLFYDDKIIGVDNSSIVSFDLVRLISRKDKTPEVLFDSSSDDFESKKDMIAEYINFAPTQIRVSGGVANYAFSFNSSDVDAIFRATISTKDKNGKVAVYKESNDLTVKVRGYYLDISSIINGIDTSNLKAGSTESINFQIKTFNKENTQVTNLEPIYLNVYDYNSGEKIGDEITYNSSNFNYSSAILKKTGEYKFVFRDSIGIEATENITVTNAGVKEIKLTPSSNQIVKGNIVDILAELKDTYGNIPKGDLYNITGTISGDGVFDSNSEKTLKVSVLDGFYNFKVRSTGGAGNIQIKFVVDSEQAESSILTVNVVDYAKTKISIEDAGNIVVGKEKHKLNLQIVDGGGSLLSKFNGIAYFDFNELNGVISPNFVKIENGKPTEDIFLIPNFVAAQNLTINTTVPGIEDVEGNKVTIFPDKPMYVGLQNTKSKLEAKAGNKSTIKASLYDRYSNIVFNDSAHSINFYVPDEYKKYVNLGLDTYTNKKIVIDGETSLEAYATNIPGSSYILAEATPALETNTVVIKGQNDEELTASGVSQNAVLFNTYYLFNKEKLDNINYNALYTVLEGANYGDITHPGYLGGEILFNKDSRSLGVSSTINNVSNRQTAFGFTPGGKFIANTSTSNDTFALESTINSNTNGTAINLYDSVYKELIARAWLNFDSEVELVDCGMGDDSVGKCSIPTDSTYIMLKGNSGVSTRKNATNMELYLNNFKIFDIDKSGRINKDPGITITLDNDSVGNMLGMKLMMNKQEIGYLGIKFKTDKINVFDSGEFPNILYTNKNQIVIEKISNEYYFDTTFLGISSHGAKGVEFYKNSDSDDESVDTSLVSVGNKIGLENYTEQAGIGWEGKNKMLLEFAGGNSIGESTKFYQTYSMVNLGDPVVSLDTKSQPNSDFDRSIGKRLTEEKGSVIESYKKIDFNGDKNDDIVVFYEDGHIELLANYNGNLKNMGNLAYITDAGKLRKGVGDFTGDSFDDIVFANKNGQLGLLNNIKGKFSRQQGVILNEANNQEVFIDGQIEQLEVFDMNNDGIDDIVTVDDSGDLSILYGTSGDSRFPGKIVFQKKIVDNSLGIKLKSTPVKTGGAIYYDSFPQLPDFTSQSQYLLQSQELQNNTGSSAADTTTLSAMLNKLLYYQEKYQEYSNSGVTTQEEREQVIRSTIGTDENGNPNNDLAQELIDSQNALVVSNGSGLTNIDAVNTSVLEKTKTFLRSQYGQAYDLDISKTYRDVNGGKLQAGDQIEVNIKIANNSSKKLNNVLYYDSNKNFIKVDDNSIYTITTDSISEKRPLNELIDGEFDYAFRDFSLKAGETAKITYNLLMPSVSFGLITVGLLEKNDSYGDIALNPTSGCGDDQLIWASIAAKDYKKGKRTFTDKSKLPDAIEKNKVDTDGNGIPDYIDELNGSGTGQLAQDYAKTQLAELNKDSNKNGIPDKDEEGGSSLFNYNGSSGEVEMGGLNVSNFDQINSTIDTVVNGLGCGFGGGGCITTPLNWAPLAPGSSPTLFGIPVAPNMMLPGGSGFPIFSKLYAPFCSPLLPPTWPPCPIGAGGILDGVPTGIGWSSLRIFVTPTITGAVGTAICWGPNFMYNYTIGSSPYIPGGNCVVAAAPLIGCKNDGSDGNVGSLGAYYGNGNNYFNASSCIQNKSGTGVSPETQSQIIQYIRGDLSQAKNIMNSPSVQHGNVSTSNEPIIGLGSSWGSGDSGDSLDINLDTSALKNLDFDNVIKVDFKRVSSFPDFIMDWATRQIEEIVNKLVTLPTLKIILPDFSGLADSGWLKFGDKYEEAQNKLVAQDKAENAKKEALNKEKETKKETVKDPNFLQKAQNFVTTQKDELQKKEIVTKAKDGISGVKAAYEVVSNLPLIKLDQEQINVDIPWIGPEEIDKWIINAKGKLSQYKTTYENTKKSWSGFIDDPKAAVSFKALLDADKLIKSVEKNIKILEEYKKFPTKFRKYITWKEMYMTQILCNLEIINKVTGGRIKDNGKRFKTWVQLIVLIKAILKSWQLIIDIFKDYNQNCAVCHNERYALKYWITKLVSILIPKLPIIIFPKWPDIIIDLHNIRAGLNITMPEFNFNVKPIVLPQLPDLILPSTPSLGLDIKFSLPNIGTLPSLPELPDLPELPSLPSVKLPDLPPPPTVPKLFGVIQAMLQLLKLISKVFCLRNNFGHLFPPEWRAGDTIAWMTERNGTSPIDKLFIDLPNFSVSFIDAIKVTSFVNLEFDAAFITEMAKSTLEPFNKFSNNLSNLNRGSKIPSLDFNSVVPKIDDINLDLNTNTKKPGAYIENPEKAESYFGKLAGIALGSIMNMNKMMLDNQNKTSDIYTFKKDLQKSIAMLANSANPKERQIFNELSDAINYKTSNEDKFIDDLYKQNEDKFDNLKSLIKEYQKENIKLNKELQQIENGEKSIKDFSPIKNTYGGLKVVAGISDNNKQILTNKISKQDDNFLAAVNNISGHKDEDSNEEIKKLGESVIQKINLEASKYSINKVQEQTGSGYISPNLATTNNDTNASSLEYTYNYEGIYITNKNGKQTRLFDYLDEVEQKSNIVELDVDGDGDEDVIYTMGGALYYKENLSKKPVQIHIGDIDGTKDIADINGFLGINSTTNTMPFAPNYFEETTPVAGNINFQFASANRNKEKSFRLEFYDYIERFDATNNIRWRNKGIFPFARLNLVDMVTSNINDDIIENKDGLNIKNTFATLDTGIGTVNAKIPDYKVLESGDSLTIQSGKTIYAGIDGLTIKYKYDSDSTYKIIRVESKNSIQFSANANVTILNGSMYLIYNDSIQKYTGDISALKGMPILPGFEVYPVNNNSYFNVLYIGGNILTVDNGATYRMISLGSQAELYYVNIESANEFYYGKMYAFNGLERTNFTDLTLMSPQMEADNEPPLISLDDGIKLPVYKQKTINLKKYITDISGIKELYIDADINIDSDSDGALNNDKDSLDKKTKLGIKKGNTIHDIIVGPYSSLINKKVMLYTIDYNNNKSANLVDFEVYSPIPTINSIDKNKAQIKGIIDETISEEPIDIFRFRDGILSKIGSQNKNDYTDSTGGFDITGINNNKGLVITKKITSSGTTITGTIALINEVTGRIDIKDGNYGIRIIGAQENQKSTLEIYNKGTSDIIYKQSFNLSSNQSIQQVNDFGQVDKGIFFVSKKQGFGLVKNASNIQYLANGAYIIDSNHNGIIGIGADGNIYILDNNYNLSYDTYGDNVVINIINLSGEIVGSIMYNVSAFYILK